LKEKLEDIKFSYDQDSKRYIKWIEKEPVKALQEIEAIIYEAIIYKIRRVIEEKMAILKSTIYGLKNDNEEEFSYQEYME
jgi:nitrogen regulatory protein PII-like uncharacterized protein